MEAVLFQSNTRQDLKEFVGLAKKVGITVQYVKNYNVFPQAVVRRKNLSRNNDLDIINRNVDYLNSEAEDVLSYQAF
ncbi:MAG: hypothetical protein FWE23_07365 [Chitinivibrionia bacterium]|nr:hypothetical protein [Chitinivibrionia bacterium]